MGSLTDVPGLAVGHATDRDAATGCTVVLGPFRGACDVRGTATGTRELGTLSLLHIVDRVDAVLLTGGSAYGLAAADGVVGWLRDRGRGFETGVTPVPIVPAAVIFDLAVGRSDRWPDAAMGRAACEAAGSVVAEGRVGAGTGATVGKLRGVDGADPGGIGSWSTRVGEVTIGALAVVNAVGDVRDDQGGIIAGARDENGDFVDTARVLRESAATAPFARPGTSTTLCVVATDAPLDRPALQSLARAGSTAIARRITPAHTPFDGDVAFALSTAGEPAALPRERLLTLCVAAAWTVERAIERAVTAG